ncbi:MAG: CrcB family protein [Planctomycetota bacterium]|nr:MAG: CrcB family protein [Planctomycetota bacterium]
MIFSIRQATCKTVQYRRARPISVPTPAGVSSCCIPRTADGRVACMIHALGKGDIMILEWFAVALGGMLGSLLRHALSMLFALAGPGWVPIATLAANVIGCGMIGALAVWSFQQSLSTSWWVVGARVGLLGGLTTFSSFGLDVVRVWQSGKLSWSLTLTCLHVALGISAVVAGMRWAESWAHQTSS